MSIEKLAAAPISSEQIVDAKKIAKISATEDSTSNPNSESAPAESKPADPNSIGKVYALA